MPGAGIAVVVAKAMLAFDQDYNDAQAYVRGWLQVYDARTMSSVPVAKVAMPQRVPTGFHGLFVHQEELKKQSD